MAIRVCLAGATGWAGSALARGIAQAEDLQLAAAVSRRQAGRSLGEVLGEPGLDCPIYATVQEALEARPSEVFFDYTRPEAAKDNSLRALRGGRNVVIGTSGLTQVDYDELREEAEHQQRAVLAVGNFALTAVLLQKFAEMAARLIPQWEIIDYAHDDKRDAPSGTARELAARLSRVRAPEFSVPLEEVQGVVETRGGQLDGSQVHSVRLPGYTISLEILFGLKDQRLSLRHDSGSSAEPYVGGGLLAIRKVGGLVGLHRGLESVLELD